MYVNLCFNGERKIHNINWRKLLLPPIKGGSIVERVPVHGSNFVRSYTKSQPHHKSSLPYPDFWQFEVS